MELGLNEIISLLIVFVSLLLASFLLSSRSENYTGNMLLALFLIVCAQDADIIFINRYVYPNYPALGLLINSTSLLKVPLIFLYILTVIYSDFKFKWKHLLHAIPFLLINISLIPRFYSGDYQQQLDFLTGNTFQDKQPEIQVSYFVLHIQITAYVIAGFIAVARYRRLLLENYSNASLFHYKWLFQLLLVFTAGAFVASLKNLFMVLGLEKANSLAVLLTSFLILGYIIWMVFRAMHNPELFKGIDSKLQPVSRMVKANGHPEAIKTVQTDQETYKKVALLNSFMAESEPYLDPSLSIYNLSKQINIPAKDLSLLINHDLNQHFFDFVNSFRIRKAMEMLKDPVKKDLTVLEILYEVGFNSKSSFNTAFKKHTRLTPTEYRRKYLLSAA